MEIRGLGHTVLGAGFLCGGGILLWAAWSMGERQERFLNNLRLLYPLSRVSPAFQRFFLGVAGLGLVLGGIIAMLIGLGIAG